MLGLSLKGIGGVKSSGLIEVVSVGSSFYFSGWGYGGFGVFRV